MESMLQAVYGNRNARVGMMVGDSLAAPPDWAKAEAAEVDEHLARAGYNVRPSDLPDLAQRIEILENLIGAAPEELLGGISQDTVHYNPSDIGSWVNCLLDEIVQLPAAMATTTTTDSDSSSAITNATAAAAHHHPPAAPPAAYAQSPSSSSSVLTAVPPATAATTTEELGVRLVHLLLACANAVQRQEMVAAGDMARELRSLLAGGAADSSGAMGRVAAHFVEGLCRRIFGAGVAVVIPGLDVTGVSSATVDEILHFHFYETCPYLKFAHFTANQAILEAFEGQSAVHVVDFNLEYGLQWPALIQALALRPGGPPQLRLTGIGPPQPGGKDLLQEIGLKLAQMAESVDVEFTFHGVVAARLEDVRPWMLTCRNGEAIAVNSVFQLHRILVDGEGSSLSTSPPCSASPVGEVLRWVRALNPVIVTVVEQDADHNGNQFLDRFMSALHYYSTMFDSLEACNLATGSWEQVVAEAYLGREVVDIVASEGPSRVERHESLDQWRCRMNSAGFQPLFLGSNAFRQASMLLTLFSGDGYRVVENSGCLTLGWHSRSLVAASAWRCSS